MPSQLNPQIRTMEIGVRHLRQITIYPLSMSDQFKTTDLVSDFVVKTLEFLESAKNEELQDIAAIPVIIKSVENNLVHILDFIVDKKDKIKLNDLTNLQFSELAVLVYEVNYEGALGKFQGLIQKVKDLIPSMRPQATSSLKQVID